MRGGTLTTAGRTALLPGSDRFTTDDHGAEDRARMWQRTLSKWFVDVAVAAHGDASFPARLAVERYGAVQLATEESGPSTIVRSPRAIASDPRNHMFARLQTDGDALLLQDGRSVRLRPGELALYDAARPYKLVYGGRQCSRILMVPRALLRLEEAVIRQVTAVGIDEQGDEPAALLLSLLAGLLDELPSARLALREQLARSAADIVSAIATEQAGRVAEAGEPRQVLLERVKAAVEQRLGDPDLSPRDLADQHNISLRYLHLLFQQQGSTVNGWVRTRRLEAARRELARPDARRRSVAAIAAQVGFANSSHFSRAFKDAFGMSPMQWRNSVQTFDGARTEDRTAAF